MHATNALPSAPPAAPDAPRPAYTLREIQARVGGEIVGDPDTRITGVNAVNLARPGELTFAESPAYEAQLRANQAAAVIVPPAFPVVKGRTLLRVEHPRLAFLKALALFQPPRTRPAGIHRQAMVSPDAVLGEEVTVQEGAVIRPRARIGEGTVVESGAFIGEDVVIGTQCCIGPNVVVLAGCQIGHRVILHAGTVVGSDGFGYIWTEGRHLKVPQLGNVVIEDDVELGANVCVDRATLGSTRIKRGTKVDNLVQIAHNDVIGEHVTMSGQVGLAGSVTIGDRVVLAGQVGVADHVTIGDDVKVGAQGGVTKSLPAGQTVWGTPARPLPHVKRELAALALLPRLLKQLQRVKRPPRRRAR